MEESFIIVGRFTRVIKNDGTLLFKPLLRDSTFLSTVTHLYHAVFHTVFEVASVTPVSRGFHVRIAEVEKPYEAEYLVGEEFALPRSELIGKTCDALIGCPVISPNGKHLGSVSAVTATPRYLLLTISGDQKEVEVPLISPVARLDGEKIIVTREEFYAD